jgi:hypothetical protein
LHESKNDNQLQLSNEFKARFSGRKVPYSRQLAIQVNVRFGLAAVIWQHGTLAKLLQPCCRIAARQLRAQRGHSYFLLRAHASRILPHAHRNCLCKAERKSLIL